MPSKFLISEKEIDNFSVSSNKSTLEIDQEQSKSKKKQPARSENEKPEKKKEVIEVEGIVKTALPNAMFEVELPNEHKQ